MAVKIERPLQRGAGRLIVADGLAVDRLDLGGGVFEEGAGSGVGDCGAAVGDGDGDVRGVGGGIADGELGWTFVSAEGGTGEKHWKDPAHQRVPKLFRSHIHGLLLKLFAGQKAHNQVGERVRERIHGASSEVAPAFHGASPPPIRSVAVRT